ncbi:MAG TPA: hypothetical protein VH299_06540 [Solirubrobacterales bacterium]|nr:hypothetical protein [Solirubrobacterales bacterium]
MESARTHAHGPGGSTRLRDRVWALPLPRPELAVLLVLTALRRPLQMRRIVT